jgi:hypothetical protein
MPLNPGDVFAFSLMNLDILYSDESAATSLMATWRFWESWAKATWP